MHTPSSLRLTMDRGPWNDIVRQNVNTVYHIVWAIDVIQEGSNVAMYKNLQEPVELKYNRNNVWHLIKTEGTVRSSWVLYYEGKEVFGMQESSDADYDYRITLIDAYGLDEWPDMVIKRAQELEKRFG